MMQEDRNPTISLLIKQIEALQFDIEAIESHIAHLNEVTDTPEHIPVLRDLQSRYRELIVCLSTTLASFQKAV
jgi:prefoldin subunit 5